MLEEHTIYPIVASQLEHKKLALQKDSVNDMKILCLGEGHGTGTFQIFYIELEPLMSSIVHVRTRMSKSLEIRMLELVICNMVAGHRRTRFTRQRQGSR
jgi:hypothetical protein